MSQPQDLNDFRDSAFSRDDVAVPDDATMIEGDDYFVFHVRARPEVGVLPTDAATEDARPAAC